MDEDYEKSNAREWDLNYQAPPKQQTTRQKPDKKIARAAKNPFQALDPHALRAAQHQQNPNRPAWLVQRSAKKIKAGQQEQRSPLIDLGDSLGNTAETAWRRHERPLASISVPEELVWCDQQQEAIAKKFGTFVFSQDHSGEPGSVRFDIWGEPDGVAHTRQAIHNWVQRDAPSKHQLGLSKFGKTRSLLPQQRQSEERKWAREVKRQRLRQFPPLGTAFGAIGTFHWPVQDYQPHEVLGNNYEALDPIRMECSCYVVFEKSAQAFQVMGEIGAVKAALLRIRKTCFQIAARQVAPVRKYVFLFDQEQDVPSNVTLESFERIQSTGPGVGVPQEQPAVSPQGCGNVESQSLRDELVATSTKNVKAVGKIVLLMLAKLHYYLGHLKLRIRLGSFLATSYRAPEDGMYAIDDFHEMTLQSQFTGEVTAELGKRLSETEALRTLQSADDFFFPCDNSVSTLAQIKPIYTAIFIIADKAGDMRLEMSWHEVQDGKRILERVSTRWSRLDRGMDSASPLVDISLLNLGNRTAWQFDLLATQVVEDCRLAQEHRHLIESIRVDGENRFQKRPDKLFVKWSPYAHVKVLQQRVSYQFGLMNSDFILELSRFQDRVYTQKSRLPGNADCQTYEQRWCLEVYHNNWDTMLTKNEHLAVGEMADWDEGVKNWFPEDDEPGNFSQVKGERGFEQLVAKLGLIEKLVVKTEDEGSKSFGGMDVG